MQTKAVFNCDLCLLGGSGGPHRAFAAPLNTPTASPTAATMLFQLTALSLAVVLPAPGT